MYFPGLYDTTGRGSTIEPCPELDASSSDNTDGVVLNKDPVMLLNEFCQRSQQKVRYIILVTFYP